MREVKAKKDKGKKKSPTSLSLERETLCQLNILFQLLSTNKNEISLIEFYMLSNKYKLVPAIKRGIKGW